MPSGKANVKLRLCIVITMSSLRPVFAVAEVHFADVTTAAGIAFHHQNGATGEKHIPETMGSGVAFFDYDGDGGLDLYFVNTAEPGVLYRNNGDGTFSDVTALAGVGNSGYGMGCAAADYDNDGDLDLYITCYGPNLLYRNNGDGTFTDVTALAGVGDPGFGQGTALADYDMDGDLVLYVANYLEYRPELNQHCGRVKGIRVYCGPDAFPPQPDVFYRNNGDGTFTDVTEAVGLVSPGGKEIGAIFSDLDNDGDPDLYVASDRKPNLLYRNDRGRFTEVGALAGVAYNEDGNSLAGMGVTVADYDNDGFFDLFVTNFQWEPNTLYHNLGNGLFADVTFVSGLGMPSLSRMSWGTAFLDYDNDGDRDLFVANGHIDPNYELFDNVTHAQQDHLFRNDGEGRFTEVGNMGGSGLALKQVGRGLSVGDYDNDGDLDIVVSNNDQPAALLRNDGGNGNHWLSLKLVGAGAPVSNRDGIGARIKVAAGDATSASKLVQVHEIRSGSSYLSQEDLRAFFGLGAKDRVELVEIRWPSGVVQQLRGIAADQFLTVYELREP